MGKPVMLYVAIRCDACDDKDPIATAYVSPGSVLSLPDHVCAPQPTYPLAAPDPLRGWAARRWHCYMGRFPVPDWLYDAAPLWMHGAADWLGGVEPSPWVELWGDVWGRVAYSRPVCLAYRVLKGRDRV